MKLSIEVGKGIEKYIQRLEQFEEASDGILKATIYPGAKIIADELRKAVESLPEIKTNPKETKSKGTPRPKDTRKRDRRPKPAGVTKVEKEGLLDGLGIAKMRFDDSDILNAKIGMDGYNKHVTPKWPKGHPNIMIARSVEHGTSFRQKTPFIEPTARKYKDIAEQKMAHAFDNEVQKYW